MLYNKARWWCDHCCNSSIIWRVQTVIWPTFTVFSNRRLMSHLNNTHFQGVSGPVQFQGADRTGIININQHVGNSTVEVGQYHHEMNVSLQLNMSAIVWPAGGIPSDGRPREFGRFLKPGVRNLIAVLPRHILVNIVYTSSVTDICSSKTLQYWGVQGSFTSDMWPSHCCC